MNIAIVFSVFCPQHGVEPWQHENLTAGSCAWPVGHCDRGCNRWDKAHFNTWLYWSGVSASVGVFPSFHEFSVKLSGSNDRLRIHFESQNKIASHEGTNHTAESKGNASLELLEAQ